jgi:hypothetical protein
MTPDGRYITFESRAVDLVPGVTDSNTANDMFLYDRVTDAMSLISRAFNDPMRTASTASTTTHFRSARRVMSDDGRFVVYSSGASNLVAGFIDNNGALSGFGGYDAYVYDRVTQSNTLISRSAINPNAGADGDTYVPSISGNGRLIAFDAVGEGLVAGFLPYAADENNHNIFTYDQTTGQIELVTHNRTNALLADYEFNTWYLFNYSGNALLYESRSPRYVHGDFNPYFDVFAYVTPPPRVASVLVDAGSAQRSVVRSLTVAFDQAVIVGGDAFEVVRVGGGVVPATVTALDPKTWRVSFGSSLADGRYTLRVKSTAVANLEALDGDADGIAGGDHLFQFHRLFGDADGNAKVDAADFLAFRLGFALNNPIFDYDGDGAVSPADFLQFRLRFLQAV